MIMRFLPHHYLYWFFIFFERFIHLYERERACACGGGGPEGENLQVDSALSAEPEVGLSSTT